MAESGLVVAGRRITGAGVLVVIAMVYILITTAIRWSDSDLSLGTLVLWFSVAAVLTAGLALLAFRLSRDSEWLGMIGPFLGMVVVVLWTHALSGAAIGLGAVWLFKCLPKVNRAGTRKPRRDPSRK